MQETNGTMRSLELLMAQVIDAARCTGCGACAGTCPYLMTIDDRIVPLDRCTVDTGHCANACPQLHVDEPRPDETHLDGLPRDDLATYRAQVTPRAIRDRRGGGVVTELLCFGLEAGYISGALVTGGSVLSPELRVARSTREIREAAGEKPSVLPLGPFLQRVSDVHKIAVVALPCHALGIDRITSDAVPEPLGRPLVIGLHCGGAYELGGLRRVAGTRAVAGVVRESDTTSKAALRIDFEDGGTRRLAADVSAALGRPACRECEDLTAEAADLSVGRSSLDPDWNTVIVRTPRGRELWEAARSTGVIKVEELPQSELDTIRSAASAKRASARAFRTAAEEQRRD